MTYFNPPKGTNLTQAASNHREAALTRRRVLARRTHLPFPTKQSAERYAELHGWGNPRQWYLLFYRPRPNEKFEGFGLYWVPKGEGPISPPTPF